MAHSALFALASALLQPRPPTTIVIDEPELGLHPVALEALAALINETSQRTQLLVSTQSATLLDHFDPDQGQERFCALKPSSDSARHEKTVANFLNVFAW